MATLISLVIKQKAVECVSKNSVHDNAFITLVIRLIMACTAHATNKVGGEVVKSLWDQSARISFQMKKEFLKFDYIGATEI